MMSGSVRRSTRAKPKPKAEPEPVVAKKVPAKKAAPKTKTKAAPQTPRNQKRAAKFIPKNSTKKRKTGLKGTVNSTQALGVVDPASNLSGDIAVDDNGEPYDAMLVFIEATSNTDKYFVLQLIELDDGTDDGDIVIYTRWGRTGTAGSALVESFTDFEEAIKSYDAKFKSKTGLSWADREDPPIASKYYYIHQNFDAKLQGYNVMWQYWVDDGIDGKSTGWYNYDPQGATNTEQLYSEAIMNSNFNLRSVSSGMWVYAVDFIRMKQTNVVHPNHTSRHIRRLPPGASLDKLPPQHTRTAPVCTQKATPVKKSVKKPKSAKPEPVTPKLAASARNIRQVDVDVVVAGKTPADFKVVSDDDGEYYDSVMNQCDITGSTNSNKYYKVSIYKHKKSGQYGVWTRWGRVGEALKGNTSKWFPETTLEDAVVTFSKKYKDKTGNAWGADEFKPKFGKYQPVEIDTNKTAENTPMKTEHSDIEYMPSILDAKTLDLVQTLFSSDVRNAALDEFNLDLKKLPLGVPSQQQIQRGVDVLQRISDRLAKPSKKAGESLAELSSLFYTTIPHSFGRSRPPVIDTAVKLQERFDMCDILSDMYETQQNMDKISVNQPTKKIVPHPADQHYLSLKADLKPLDSNSNVYRAIQKYFDVTKSGNSQLLDVWTVDREGEGSRYKAFDALDNRRLLWHGTNLAVVAPILTNGLRIMPHSGGRVGKGIYLAAENSKSRSYTSAYGSKYACMFLAEAALGTPHEITKDDSSLRAAPAGSDSVHAVGRMTPGSWKPITLEKKQVTVPQSAPKDTKVDSSFYQDEFLVYSESQVRTRYLITLKL
ncbi:hypothetical protein SARC_03377 [Sphaeroforma arctica JP610]|uniref:Poly [ADP-ribose] polymerase n=1 Tax=Sphaeroforma arctica JP610 TaxID=667725 RepID=A0A0L0G5W2_9EUKA|nr:hypothetical protein SARC_03377 [Sphaeroforma arctica JP610]KNC84415.1 hypothetical protein SARC_03377 [Sphaeroforma arctica JP610]|eukprot:XP_014158317.1 hypothetical protein SARC_03377 [Sphaeroforma arctica JP610]